MSYSASDFVEDVETILDCFNVPEPNLTGLQLDPEDDYDHMKILAERVSQRFAALDECVAVLRDVAALLPTGRLHPQDLFALQTRVCASIAKVQP